MLSSSRRPTFVLGERLFLRLLGGIYLIAFVSFGMQARGLVGSRGILPLAEFLRSVHEFYGRRGYGAVPSLFWISSTDGAIRAVWIAGIVGSALLLLGIRNQLVIAAPLVLYLSIVSSGQMFMNYQWDALLLESGFLAIFLGLSPVVSWLYRWLLFRLMLLSGAVKLLSGDPAWRNFTALPIHYQTQPLPTPLAWYAYHLPAWFQKMSMGVMFAAELVVPFLYFAPQPLRVFAALATVVFQLTIFLTGNYTFFNLLTIALCLFLLDDDWLRRRFPGLALRVFSKLRPPAPSPWRHRVAMALAVFVLTVSIAEIAERLDRARWGPTAALIEAVAPLEIVNTYGLFAVMTTRRMEIVVEGSRDGATWLPYQFKYKPGDLARRPGWIEPLQPRLDWQMWFAALGDYRSDPWTLSFLQRLLEGSPDVIRLLANDPFPGSPPQYVHALLYEYQFTTSAEKRATGNWWRRELRGVYIPAISLPSP